MKHEEQLTSIGIVICYIGRLPEWFPLWVKSCAGNSSIDFFLYTDQKLEALPENIIVHVVTLSDLQKRFSRVLGFECSLEAPYKLCDYRAIYGEAFQKDLCQYEFWGHCDLDMVFGDLRKFITEDILHSFDRIFEVGHLCLYRNCNEVNQLYCREGALFPYRKVFMEKHYCGFDEHTGMTRICELNQVKTYKKVVCADIDPHYRAFHMMDEDTIDGIIAVENFKNQIFIWENGKTWQIYLDDNMKIERKEVSYVHFMRKFPAHAERCKDVDAYCITYKLFIPLKECITPQFILENAFTANGITAKIEYMYIFIQNGIRALKSGELGIRIKLRINRIKKINARKVGR